MKTLLFAGLALASAPAVAQTQAQELIQWSAPVSSVDRYAYFPMGTELKLTTRTELNTKSSNAGDRFRLEVAEPLIYRGQVVVPVGSVAVGEVMRAEKNGWFGKRGQIEVRMLYVQTPSGPVRLSGQKARSGTGQELLSIGGALLISWPMMFIHGTSGKLAHDTAVSAYLADDLRFPLQESVSPIAAEVTPDAYAQAPRRLPASFDPGVFASRR